MLFGNFVGNLAESTSVIFSSLKPESIKNNGRRRPIPRPSNGGSCHQPPPPSITHGSGGGSRWRG